MKYLKIFLLLITISFFSCDTKKGDTSTVFIGTEQNLPNEIKGLKLYWVSTSDGALSGGIYVGYFYLLLIQPQIGNLGASAQIALLANNAITYIVMMGNLTTPHNYGVFNLHSSADMATIVN